MKNLIARFGVLAVAVSIAVNLGGISGLHW